MARFTMLDGATTIGGTKLLFEAGSSPDSTRLLFDFGLSYATMGKYFEEFLKPRTSAGLTDYLFTGLLPRMQLYRSDLTALLRQMHPEVAAQLSATGSIAACFITHAHVDHTGSISFLDESIPLYATSVTAAMLRGIEETQYTSRDEDEITSFILRPNLGAAKRGCRRLIQADCAVEFPDCRVTPYPVDHSVPGACAYLIEYAGGKLVYTGDLRFHGRMGQKTLDTVSKLAELHPDTLIIEGTNLRDAEPPAEPAFARRFVCWKETDVEERALEEVRCTRGLVIADFGMKDLDRLLTFQNVARATGRRIAILPRDAYVAQQVADAGQETIKLEDPDLALYIKRNRSGIYDARDMVKDWARTTILKFAVPNPNALDHSDSMRELGSALRGAFPRIVRAQEVNAKQSKYLLCLGYWDIQELCDLQPSPGSLYIHSSAEPFNEEMSWSQERLARWLSLNRMDSVHIHASGHARPEDLFQIVERLSPRRVYPIHTEHPEQYVEHFGDIVSLIANGQEVPL